MSALTQYIKLFEANREVIYANSAPALNALRPAALELLKQSSLPRRGEEGYEKTDLDEWFAPDFGLNISRVNIPVDIAKSFKCDVPNLSTLLGLVINDTFVPTSTLLANLPEGVIVTSLRHAAIEHHDLIAAHYGKIASADDAATALNTLLAQDGVFIYLGRSIKVERPIQIVNISSSPVAQMSVRRILIIAEAGSSADILLCDHSQGESAYLTTQVIEADIQRDAAVNIIDLEETTASTHRLNQFYARQHNNSQLALTEATLLNGHTRNELTVNIKGSHAYCRLNGIAIGRDSQLIDNCSNVIHAHAGSRSNQLFRYVLDHHSIGSFEGGIEVAPGASQTEAYQSNGNVLASPDARMHTKPRLLIYNDDVKCSHGASTGQLDESALFYMQTRGIPRHEAEQMLMEAYVADVLAHVNPVIVRDRLSHLISKRFSGTLATCHSCSTACK